MVQYHFHNTFSYEPLRKLIKKRRMTISSFGKRLQLSKTDLYRMQIDQIMSIVAEYKICIFFECDVRDIRKDIHVEDPTEEIIDLKKRGCRTTRYYYFE